MSLTVEGILFVTSELSFPIFLFILDCIPLPGSCQPSPPDLEDQDQSLTTLTVHPTMASLGKMARHVVVLSALLMAAFYLMPFLSFQNASPALTSHLVPRDVAVADFTVPQSRNSSLAYNGRFGLE